MTDQQVTLTDSLTASDSVTTVRQGDRTGYTITPMGQAGPDPLYTVYRNDGTGVGTFIDAQIDDAISADRVVVANTPPQPSWDGYSVKPAYAIYRDSDHGLVGTFTTIKDAQTAVDQDRKHH